MVPDLNLHTRYISAHFFLMHNCVLVCVPSAGAMRLPCPIKTKEQGEITIHFLTDYYINKFKLPKAKFVNVDDNGLLKFYNETPIRMKGEGCEHCYIMAR